jgi:hypothetical protein
MKNRVQLLLRVLNGYCSTRSRASLINIDIGRIKRNAVDYMLH